MKRSMLVACVLSVVWLLIIPAVPLDAIPSFPEGYDVRDRYPTAPYPVRDQGPCGSCYAHAVAGAIEMRYRIKSIDAGRGVPIIDLSEQQIMSCEPQNLGCSGGYPYYSLGYARDTGLVEESIFPYSATDEICPSFAPDLTRYSISGFETYQSTDVDGLRQEIYDNGPVIAAIELYDDLATEYESGIYDYQWGNYRTNVAAEMVGWGEEGGVKYFTFKRAWGPDWGEQGYVRINVNSSVIKYPMYAPDVVLNPPTCSPTCQNGGICVAEDTCQCASGWSGPGCTVPSLCSPGFYSPTGLQPCSLCPAGRYGATSGLTSPACSGACNEGHYCPAGSTAPNASTCPADTYCPTGSATPFSCPLGTTSPAGSDSFEDCVPRAVVTNTSDGGPGSLRDAIEVANAAAGLDLIVFDIPGTGPHTIRPTNALPTISDSVIIDGFTQAGAVPATSVAPAALMIELDGSLAGQDADGLAISTAGSLIRGLAINRFGANGIWIGGADTVNNRIEGNYIGTDTAGNLGLGNTNGVVLTDGATDNLVGGSTVAARNVVSGNTDSGVAVAEPGTARNAVSGNYIGSDSTGTTAIPNLDGIWLGEGATDTSIAGNVASGNVLFGVSINGSGAVGTLVTDNLIGTSASGSGPLANGAGGVVLTSGTGDNIIGGTEPGEGNTIAFNGGPGIKIHADGGTGNRLRNNWFYSNDGLGIDLNDDGVTINDWRDIDDGANGLQNYPELHVVQVGGPVSETSISFQLSSVPNRSFLVDLYLSETCDSYGFGEGQTHLGDEEWVTTNYDGLAPSTIVRLYEPLPAGYAVTATASEGWWGNTSEFSRCVHTVRATASADPFAVYSGETVALTGTAIGGDGSPFNHVWTQTFGPAVTLSGINQPTTQFVAPDVEDVTVLAFSLVAADGSGGVGYDDIAVTVHPADVPANVDEATHTVSPGGTVTSQLDVPPYMGALAVNTRWAGSDVEATLIAPSGLRLTRSQIPAGVTHLLGATFEAFTVPDPEPGTWQVELFGADVPDDGEEVSVESITVAAEIDVGVEASADQIKWKVKNGKIKGVAPGNLWMILYGSGQLEVADVNASSVRLGDPNLEASIAPTKVLTGDVDGDGFMDLRCRFKTKQLVERGAINADTTLLRLTANTHTGAILTGDDAIETDVDDDR